MPKHRGTMIVQRMSCPGISCVCVVCLCQRAPPRDTERPAEPGCRTTPAHQRAGRRAGAERRERGTSAAPGARGTAPVYGNNDTQLLQKVKILHNSSTHGCLVNMLWISVLRRERDSTPASLSSDESFLRRCHLCASHAMKSTSLGACMRMDGHGARRGRPANAAFQR